jgi:hypothetical protein
MKLLSGNGFIINEREPLYITRKILNLPPYWTEDKILRNYKFVNTKEHGTKKPSGY